MTEATMKQVELQDGASPDIVQENVQHLKELFPDAFTENGVNFDTLRQLLGDLKVLDEGEEKYGLNWHGKKQARQIALTPSLGTLLPCPEESVDWDTTQNLFIEGDNLEVLKLLQKSYANKVKMIYIDPPYNTGKEFVYPDKFQDNLDTYLKYTGQKDDEGLKFTSNTETGGRKHTNWLNMMYPRLKLARNLMRDDGVIFISIDDNEQVNLKAISDDIFGEENCIAVISREAIKGGSLSKHIRMVHDYVLVYAKSSDELVFSGYEKEALTLDLKDEKGSYAKSRELNKWGAGSRREDAPGMYFPIKGPNGVDVYPVRNDGSDGRWRLGKERMYKLVEEDNIIFEQREDGTYVVYEKIRSSEAGIKQFTTLFKDNYINAKGTERIKSIFEIERSHFDYAKPCELIIDLIVLADVQDNEIVMDFFAGSATSSDATMQLNALDCKKRRHIQVQLPEITEEKSEAHKAGYKNIADISKERIRRAAKKIQEENPDYKGDLGFKVFKLASSNIKVWNPDRTDFEGSLLDHKEHLVEGRSEQDILYELLLKRGVDLTTPIETREIVVKNVYSIGYGKIITCLDDLIAGDDVEPLAAGIVEWQKELKDTLSVEVLETHVFFKDSAFRDDVAKTNMAAILSQNGIDHVRSL